MLQGSLRVLCKVGTYPYFLCPCRFGRLRHEQQHLDFRHPNSQPRSLKIDLTIQGTYMIGFLFFIFKKIFPYFHAGLFSCPSSGLRLRHSHGGPHRPSPPTRPSCWMRRLAWVGILSIAIDQTGVASVLPPQFAPLSPFSLPVGPYGVLFVSLDYQLIIRPRH